MKAKLMALMLAVGLGITGVAATVQAAEGEPACTHPDSYKTTITEYVKADFCNPDGHYCTYQTRTYCMGCKRDIESITTLKFEPHDYEMKISESGKAMLYCTRCHDYYFM